jgi:hypothetical protein
MALGTDRIDRSGSHAVLIGVSTYQDPSFPPVPAAGNSLRGMHRMLVDEELGGWSSDQVTPISDPVDCRRVMSDLRRLAQDTSGVLLLYFVGHGTVTENGDLVLAVSDTIADEPDVTGLEYSKIRSVLRGSPAKVKAVVLDCCYSGRIIDVLAGDGQFLADSTDITGAYTLTAADRTAHAGQAGACTAFTGELLDLIRTGIAGGPPVLTFAELYPHLRRRLIAGNLPRPNQRGTDTADKCPVAKNASGNGSERQASNRQPATMASPDASVSPVRLRGPHHAGMIDGTQQPPDPNGPFTISWTGKEPLSSYTDTRELRSIVLFLTKWSVLMLVSAAIAWGLGGRAGQSSGWHMPMLAGFVLGLPPLAGILAVGILRLFYDRSTWSLQIGSQGIRTTIGFGRYEYRCHWSHVQKFTIKRITGENKLAGIGNWYQSPAALCVKLTKGAKRSTEFALAGWPFPVAARVRNGMVPVCVLGPMTDEQRAGLREALARYGHGKNDTEAWGE